MLETEVDDIDGEIWDSESNSFDESDNMEDYESKNQLDEYMRMSMTRIEAMMGIRHVQF